jgi:hypothetical protein
VTPDVLSLTVVHHHQRGAQPALCDTQQIGGGGDHELAGRRTCRPVAEAVGQGVVPKVLEFTLGVPALLG